MGFKRPLVRFQSLGPKWEKPLKLLSFDGFFFCLFRPAALFNELEFYTPKRRFKRDEKTSQNYHNRHCPEFGIMAIISKKILSRNLLYCAENAII